MSEPSKLPVRLPHSPECDIIGDQREAPDFRGVGQQGAEHPDNNPEPTPYVEPRQPVVQA